MHVASIGILPLGKSAEIAVVLTVSVIIPIYLYLVYTFYESLHDIRHDHAPVQPKKATQSEPQPELQPEPRPEPQQFIELNAPAQTESSHKCILYNQLGGRVPTASSMLRKYPLQPLATAALAIVYSRVKSHPNPVSQ